VNAERVTFRADGLTLVGDLPTSNHIDLYDQPQYVEPAAERAAAWFRRYL
jgi:hypothetical protein